MARVDITQADAVESFVKAIRSSLQVDEKAVWLTTNPLGKQNFPPGHDFFATVHVGDGTWPFADGEGVAEQAYEDVDMEVTIYSRIALDQPDKATSLLLDADRGLLPAKRKVLKSLLGSDLTTGPDGDTFLRELIKCKGSSRPEYDSTEGVGWLTLKFGLSYDWSL